MNGNGRWRVMAAVVAMILSGGLVEAPGQDRPNIVVVLVDDLRWDELGCTGHPFASTPNIDRIAHEGVRFRNAFCTTPLCSPVRACLLTGLYTHNHGILDNINRSEQSHGLVTFPRVLHETGEYETGYVGKWHMGNDDSARPGFDYWVSMKGQGTSFDPTLNENGKQTKNKGHTTDVLNRKVVDFVLKKREKPFCLYIAHKALHPELVQRDDGSISDPSAAKFLPAERHRDLYAEAAVPRRLNVIADLSGKPALKRPIEGLPPLSRETGTSDETVRDRQRMLKAVDEGVGMLFSALEASNQLNRTAVIFASDHGYWYGEHGLSVERRLPYEEAIRIPLIIRYPKRVAAGRVIDEMALSIDLAPTALDLAGLKKDDLPGMDGRSLVPLLRGRTPENWRDSFLIEYNTDTVFPRVHKMGYRAIRTEQWKYIRYLELEGMDELYDLKADPYELENRIDDPEVEDVLSDLRGKLDRLAGGPPAARVERVVDTFHGAEVEDPYRWLENWDDPEVKDWTAAQNDHTRSFLDRLPNREPIRRRVTGILKSENSSHWAVTPRGDRFFAMKDEPPKQQAFVVVLESLDKAGLESGRALIDPNEIDPEGGTTIDQFMPSPDGSLVAVSLSRHGTEAGDLHFFETSSGKEIFEVIPRVHTGTAGGDIEWAPDGSGVFYTRHPREGERPPGDLNFFQQAWFHELGKPLKDDRYEIGKDFPRIAEIEFDSHHESGQLLLTVQNGDGGEFAHYLRSPKGEWRQFSRFGDKTVKAAFSDDGKHLYFLSRKGAPRGKLLRIETKSLDVDTAEIIVPESEDTIVNSFYGRPPTIVPTRSRLFVQYQTGGPSEIRVFDLDGNPASAPKQLPVGRAGGMTRLNDGDDILFSQTSYTEPWATHRFLAEAGQTEKTAVVSRSPVDFEGVTAKRMFAISKDGTRVPVNLILPKGARKGTPGPALVTGYGGYGISLSPGFDALRKVYLEQGVTLAIANLRGGGEYGEEWHQQGNLTNKQNVFDDFAAVLNHLIDGGYTTPEQLAIEGGSNGGLLMGVTMVQNPGLMRCVVSHVGIYDMLRVELSPNGSFNIPEFGTVKKADHFRALRAYSPYHNVVGQTRYPATLFLTGVNDPRVDAMQSRKMTARLQAAISGVADRAPVILRTSLDSGHGSGTPLDEHVRQEVDVHAFVFNRLGIDYRPVANGP